MTTAKPKSLPGRHSREGPAKKSARIDAGRVTGDVRVFVTRRIVTHPTPPNLFHYVFLFISNARPETLRILVVQPLFQPGGAEKQIAALASRFLQRGHAVTLLTCKLATNEWTETVRRAGLEILETG